MIVRLFIIMLLLLFGSNTYGYSSVYDKLENAEDKILELEKGEFYMSKIDDIVEGASHDKLQELQIISEKYYKKYISVPVVRFVLYYFTVKVDSEIYERSLQGGGGGTSNSYSREIVSPVYSETSIGGFIGGESSCPIGGIQYCNFGSIVGYFQVRDEKSFDPNNLYIQVNSEQELELSEGISVMKMKNEWDTEFMGGFHSLNGKFSHFPSATFTNGIYKIIIPAYSKENTVDLFLEYDSEKIHVSSTRIYNKLNLNIDVLASFDKGEIGKIKVSGEQTLSFSVSLPQYSQAGFDGEIFLKKDGKIIATAQTQADIGYQARGESSIFNEAVFSEIDLSDGTYTIEGEIEKNSSNNVNAFLNIRNINPSGVNKDSILLKENVR